MNPPFEIGQQYTRQDAYRLLAVPHDKQGGNWDTGYTRYEQAFYVFCNVGTAGRTGHDYANRWDGDNLVWFAKAHTRINQPEVTALIGGDIPVLVFWRSEDRDPFSFAGLATAVNVQATTPVQVTWTFQQEDDVLPEEVETSTSYPEGATKVITVNRYERNRTARAKCIKHYGARCQVCDFDFQKVYGELGANVIHVHHIRELSEIGEQYEVDPIADLLPVCPNCHTMLHRTRPALSIGVLKQHIANQQARSDE